MALHAELESNTGGIRLLRGGDVPNELWNSLARNIAPERHDADAGALVVPIERFLATRNWLAQALESHSCHITFADEVRALLGRSDRERSELALLMTGDAAVDETSVVEVLHSTRFARSLKTFQQRDLARMLAMSHGANFSVPGAGKTTVAYACYEVERYRGRVDRLLVVAPLSAFGAWISEAEDCFNPGQAPRVERLAGRVPRGAEVLLVNYQRLAARYGDITRWLADGPTHVILDEAHRMKRGRSGEWGRTCLDLAHLATRRDILTGTPAPQHPRDFVALLDYLWPHQAARILPAPALRTDPPIGVMQQVSKRLAPLFVRTTKNELDLEQPNLIVEMVSMKPLQAELYEALRTRMRHASASARDRATFGQMGEVVMYLLQAATNPALLARAIGGTEPHRMTWPSLEIPHDSTLAQRILDYGRFEVPRKFEKLAAMVGANAADGRKTLVWSNFVANITELAENILAPHEPAVVHGGVPSGDDETDFTTREAELRRFRTDDACHVLVANPAAMSEGVSLHHECHDAIYLERTFNAGQYLQSIDRIHRLGLKRGTETRITFLVSSNTIDETVDERIRIKAERLSLMLDDPDLVTMALPDEESYGEWVDPEDLDALFRHLQGPSD